MELLSLMFLLYFRMELSDLKKQNRHSEKISYILGNRTFWPQAEKKFEKL